MCERGFTNVVFEGEVRAIAGRVNTCIRTESNAEMMTDPSWDAGAGVSSAEDHAGLPRGELPNVIVLKCARVADGMSNSGPP